MPNKWKAKRLRKKNRRAVRLERRVRPGNIVVLGTSGPPCPRCKQRTEAREHAQITEKELKMKFYCSRWFICRNKQCKVKVWTPDEFKVWNYRDVEPDVIERLKMIGEQIGEVMPEHQPDLFEEDPVQRRAAENPAGPGAQRSTFSAVASWCCRHHEARRGIMRSSRVSLMILRR